ncbi:ABC transporter ATP-binding protein [Mycolicibacterium nivoides]|uniref:ABC transporter ATP-binding protein n=1 Tax=Mycolicibacterium nivoides TaxID=2487344 RepID=UPI003C2C9016
MTGPLLEVSNLTLVTGNGGDEATLVEELSLDMSVGETVGVIGESGSGKSLLVRSLVGILPRGVRQTAGQVVLAGTDVSTASERDLRKLRGGTVGMVFQDSIGSLDPLFTVGRQIVEALRIHQRLNKAQALARAEQLLGDVGITQPSERLLAYPHELSGGMAQRVAIAIAIANSPALLIADEATTALDVTTQKQVIGLLKRIQAERGCGIIFVSHDLATVSELADRVVVMYAGAVIEAGPTALVLNRPRHPYTAALLRSRPALGAVAQRGAVLSGSVPLPGQWPAGCRFHPRCPYGDNERCHHERPQLEGAGHLSACHFPLSTTGSYNVIERSRVNHG